MRSQVCVLVPNQQRSLKKHLEPEGAEEEEEEEEREKKCRRRRRKVRMHQSLNETRVDVRKQSFRPNADEQGRWMVIVGEAVGIRNSIVLHTSASSAVPIRIGDFLCVGALQ